MLPRVTLDVARRPARTRPERLRRCPQAGERCVGIADPEGYGTILEARRADAVGYNGSWQGKAQPTPRTAPAKLDEDCPWAEHSEHAPAGIDTPPQDGSPICPASALRKQKHGDPDAWQTAGGSTQTFLPTQKGRTSELSSADIVRASLEQGDGDTVGRHVDAIEVYQLSRHHLLHRRRDLRVDLVSGTEGHLDFSVEHTNG